jgi:diguanylate cyclase (GGDEF)-like protein
VGFLVPIERINRYKKTATLGFRDEQVENSYHKFQLDRGRSTGIYALFALFLINLSFAMLEHWILGVKSSVPMYSYLVVAIIALAIAIFGVSNESKSALKMRVLIPAVMSFIVLLVAVFLQQYRIYHAIEISLLVIWLGSLAVLNFQLTAILSVFCVVVFTAMAYLFGATELKLTGLVLLEVAAVSLALYLSYLLERYRRMIFLTNSILLDAYDRQESWAYTLIDLDMALSGIKDFKEMINRLLEYIKPVIQFDSYVYTGLENKGPKPSPDMMDGTLFEMEDNTVWSEDLLTKLSQTRQADISAQFDIKKGFLGREKQVFQHFRMDIPVFNDSTMAGVISLRRKSEAFDDLDMTASVSLTAQAMMIFKRTNTMAQMSTQMSENLRQKTIQQVVKQTTPEPPEEKVVSVKSSEGTDSAESKFDKSTSTPSVDLEITSDITPALNRINAKNALGRDETVIPKAVIEKIQAETETAKKTITLLSRENADQIAVDRYRTAAVEGEPLSILLFEVDGLSAIREKDGDQTAYKVFAGIVKHIFSKIDKERDVLGRYGKNGLSVLLPRVDMNAAEKFAESIRLFAESAKFKTTYGDRSATVSVGVAAITDETGNYDSMVKRADMALFVAKKNGRNCVKVRL